MVRCLGLNPRMHALGILPVKRLHRRLFQRKIFWREGRLKGKERSLGVRCLILILRFDVLGGFRKDRLLRKRFQREFFLRKGELEGRGRSLAGEDC